MAGQEYPTACSRFEVLVRRQVDRLTALCEHGTIHVVWGQHALQLSAEEIGQAAGLLRMTRGPQVRWDLGCLRVLRDPDAGFQAWAHGRGMLVEAEVLAELFGLLEATDRALEGEHAFPIRHRHALAPPSIPGSHAERN